MLAKATTPALVLVSLLLASSTLIAGATDVHFAATDADGVVVKEDCTLADGMASSSGTATNKNGDVGSQQAMESANSIAVQVADASASPGAQGTTGSSGATVTAGRRKAAPQPSKVRLSMLLRGWGWGPCQ
ncbi:hypothetical protein C8Q74DRAFT_1213861 [Fomes fomentarius]|nr:hypothetical protein C8Q74DRAFT_1213861 [Fomes fomentarius]